MTVRAVSVMVNQIRDCPHTIMVPEHYHNDGTCRCTDATHTTMAAWGYTWKDGAWR